MPCQYSSYCTRDKKDKVLIRCVVICERSWDHRRYGPHADCLHQFQHYLVPGTRTTTKPLFNSVHSVHTFIQHPASSLQLPGFRFQRLHEIPTVDVLCTVLGELHYQYYYQVLVPGTGSPSNLAHAQLQTSQPV